MKRATLHGFFYGLLFFLLFASFFFYLFTFITARSDGWELFVRIYTLMLLVYTWFTFILLFYFDFQSATYPKYNNQKISIIVPCYNEPPELLRRSILSVCEAEGNKEILIVDDGSTSETREEIKRLALKYGIRFHIFEKNKGKRHALHYAVTNLIEQSDFVVTIDSDTILEKDALVRVVEPLLDPAIGASTGDVRLLNETQNWLTRMIATYYWIGLNIYKAAQSSLGQVVCCSGCLAAYRTDILKEIIDEFVNQEFFGERCTHSEDRHLTNLILKMNYKVVYNPLAISYTESPASVHGFLKQQQRWKRGYIRESTYTLSYAWRNRKILFLQVLLWDLSAPFFTFGMRLGLLVVVVTRPFYFLTYIVPIWIFFMLVRYIFVLFYAREKIRGLFVYMFFYEIFLYWMNIYALFTVKNKSWITR